MDFYRETVDDTTNPARYQVDGAWRDVTTYVEEFRDPAGDVVAVDTLRATHRGPLWRTPLGWLSMRWTALEVSDEGESFRVASRAQSLDEWYAAMAHYKAPAQNFLVADRSGRIGVRSTGRYPLRPGDGRGDKVFDGSTSASDWTGDWPLERVPRAVDPAQGYLASANQQPLDPAVRPGYLGWNWPPPWRAIRINTILRGNSAMTPEKMRLAHTDPESALTPVLLGALQAAAADARDNGTLGSTEHDAMAVFDAWDQRFDTESRGAVLFETFLAAVTRHTWDELVLPGDDRRVGTPNSMILARLLDDPSSVWWDDRRTAELTEDRNDILLEALRDAWRDTRARHGDDPATWRWGSVRRANVRHLLQLPGLGREGLSVQSGPGTLSPADGGGTHGASWRFVVELGPELRAWGTYPGGQSGNPASPRYADRIAQWQRGELAPLRIPRTPAELADSVLTGTLTFRPE
jgi:penicillin amidase